MAETVISLTKIIKLPLGTGVSEDLSRLWIPVTEQNGNNRKTVRVPFPVGDYEVACEYCHGEGVVDCPTCQGTGLGPVCDRCNGTGVEPTESTEPAIDPCDPDNPNPDGVCTKCHADNGDAFPLEGIEHAVCKLGRNADTVILHADFERGLALFDAFLFGESHGNVPAFRSKLECVAD